MQNYKSTKPMASSIPEWEYDQQKRQERKASKGLRMQRKTRKSMWMSGE